MVVQKADVPSGKCRGIVKGVARAAAKINLPEHWTKGGMEMEAGTRWGADAISRCLGTAISGA